MISIRVLAAVCLSSLSALAAVPTPKGPLSFGMSQPYGEEHAKKAQGLIEPFLTKALSSPVKVTVYGSYEELSEALAAGKVDLAWIAPLAFVRASQKTSDVTALSKAMRQGGGLFYRSVFIVKKDSAAKSLADLKGLKVAWVSKGSTSGYLFPQELLRLEGHDPATFFSAQSFAGDHPAVCKAVREGAAEVGATFASDPAEGKEPVADGCADAPPLSDFRVIASTGRIPNEVLAARADFDPRRVNEVLTVFGRMGKTPEGKQLLADAFRVEGWGIAVEGDFDPIIALVRATDAKPKVAQSPSAKPTPKPAGKKK